MNAFDWFAKWALYSPQQTAVKEALTGRSMTYAELDEAANKAFAQALCEEDLDRRVRALRRSYINRRASGPL